MLKIESILRTIRENQFRISNHAVEEMENDGIYLDDVLHKEWMEDFKTRRGS